MLGELGFVHGRQVDAVLDVAVQHVLHDQRPMLFLTDEVREAIADRRPASSTAPCSIQLGVAMYSNPRSLSKPGVRLRTTEPSFDDTSTMSSS